MDERLKQKLELLGKPALPDSLLPEELFRRIDCGELVLPEEEAFPQQPEGDPEQRVIPWAKILRRGLPIAACLALVALISQRGLWRMGSSGANLAGGAPQMAAATDQAAPAEGDGSAQLEQYNLADDDAAGEPDPGPGPRAIAIEDGGEEEESVDEDSADTAGDIAEDSAADMDEERLNVDVGLADSYDEDAANMRPDTGGPDIWTEKFDGDDADTVKAIWQPITEAVLELSQQDEMLTEMIPFNVMAQLEYDTYDDVTAYFPFGYKVYDIVTWRAIRCSIARGEDGEFYIVQVFSFEEWEPD